ncbi:MAG: hypothetical protein KGN84_21120, partial [Acidobacteriota bacterium]|nr:hypothetical protein [Acidobacteriota bacterium]
QILYSARNDYNDLRRSVDYYQEGTLIWLDADITIRTLSKGAKSLDDFCRLWAGGPSTPPEVKPYTFDDVVKTLNAVQPYDWAKFLHDRLNSTAPHAPLGGIENGGYKLVYTPIPSDFQKAAEGVEKTVSVWYSVGFVAKDSGEVIDVQVDSPAFKAGLAPAAKIVAVNGREFSGSRLRHAIEDAAHSTAPIALIVKEGEFYKTLSIDYRGGERYPHLERDPSKPDLLSKIIAPHVSK